MDITPQQLRQGLLLAVIANFIWGVSALYWIETEPVSPANVVAHRAIWSLPIAAAVLIWARRMGATWQLIRRPKTLVWSALATLLLSVNWGVFIYAVFEGQATEASLGYFMLPLLTVLVGRLLFREALGPAQRIAILLAVCAVLLQVMAYGQLPWISLAVSLSFAMYGAIRKNIEADTMQGLFIETLCMAPFALVWLWHTGGAGMGAARYQGGSVFTLRGLVHRGAVTDLYRGVSSAAPQRGGLYLVSRALSAIVGRTNVAG